MFSFSKRRMKLARVNKVQLSDSVQGFKSPLRATKCVVNSSNEVSVAAAFISIFICLISNHPHGFLITARTQPCARSNHVATLFDDKIMFLFGDLGKNKTQNDLYSLDFETMIWSRIKIRGFHPSPRAGRCGVLCGTKWYITGGGSRKKRHAETLVFDILKVEWSVASISSQSSITANKVDPIFMCH